MANGTCGATIGADMQPPGSDSAGVISVRGDAFVMVTTTPAHETTTGWTVIPWARPVRGGAWVPMSDWVYSPTVDITPADLITQQAASTNRTQIPCHLADDIYIQVISITGDIHAVTVVVSTEHGCGSLHIPEPSLSHGSLYMTAAAATALDGIETFAKLDDTTLAAGSLNEWTVSDNRLTYNGTENKDHQVVGTWSGGMSVIANISLAFAVNGVAQAQSRIGRKVPINDEGATTILLPTMEFAPGDYVELWAASNNAGNLTPTRYNYSATETADT